MPGFTDFTEIAIGFIDNYVVKAIGFCREVFINLTGFPQEMIQISVDLSLGLLGMIVVFKAIAFVKNLWGTFKGGSSSG